ncbi:LacI family DNA-binding transcriptional regulator [Microbacterium sp. zg.Y625]|uniref:LacI family DNA-binding transcriptional regulator n=1 Tax=Microbacterium jiangjiandongii TaxID=3049071 RepID=UPI00214CC4F3|nr:MULTISPECIES: LacI family DNA-binding transcriptional regulator [unclassified Microbacterium]MCR2792160.1 LacI family DNA-binding transcriptional regulator [Microbacterium sp. zg.Y625]MCR2814949.1 LacI family DNA-binding transcriptional regulator [Microbacterium sp. zg.Y843]WIM24964.1 LacI family DNA-binding transcriptional regulator [Microbacterium sp. zg-Y625]
MSGNGGDRGRVATIFDVARVAGVSHQTVSRVLNDLPNVRPATRERVEEAIAELRYVPSQAARALVTRRSRTIGLVATGLPDFGPASTVRAVNESARDAGYAVITMSLADAEVPSLRSAAEMLIRQAVEAMVLVVDEGAALAAFDGWELGVPLVAVASDSRGRAQRVTIDQYRGARAAVSHLLDLGHRDIRHIAGPEGSMDAEERLRGWRDELVEAGAAAGDLVRGDWSPGSGFRAGQRLLVDGVPGAVFVASDQMAVGLLHALSVAGLRVPEDVSVVGFDDIPEAAHLSPPLTTMRQDFVGLGQDAMAAVLAILQDDQSPQYPAPRLPQLILRASTRPV